MIALLMLLFTNDEPPTAYYPDDPPRGNIANAAVNYQFLHGWLHERRAAGELRPGLVAVGAEAVREARALARSAGLAWTAFPDPAAARVAGFPEAGLHWLLWDGAVLRRHPPAPLTPVPRETPACPGGVCPWRR